MLPKNKYPQMNRRERQSFVEVYECQPNGPFLTHVQKITKTSRSSPLVKPRHPERKLRSVLCGREKIFAFIQRGIRLNSKPNFMKRTAQAVKQALMK